MTRGDIWIVSLPVVSGREQGGQRPALVIQDDAYGQRSPLVLVVPLTSQLSATRFPATVNLKPTRENGLTLPSVALVFQTRAVDRSRLSYQLGTVSAADLERALAELRRLTGQ